jgi:hypothetical protein
MKRAIQIAQAKNLGVTPHNRWRTTRSFTAFRMTLSHYMPIERLSE